MDSCSPDTCAEHDVDLISLARLAAEHSESWAHPVAPVRIGGVERDLDADPLIMGVVNLSRDSTYRDSVAVSAESAIRRARVMHAQGAGVVDLGAESSTLRAARVGELDQAAALVPVIEALTALGVPTSVEAYSPRVVADCLTAGASVVNLTGGSDLDAIYELAATHDATVVMCFVAGANVREVADVTLGVDPIPGLIDYFGQRIDHARSHGVDNLIVDPGLGFYYGNLTDPTVRARHQTQVLLNSFRLRVLGVPICQALPHAFDLFEEEFRTAEGVFAVLAALGRANVHRTHEVARVRATLRALDAIAGAG
jgi:dihydropteroate synthase